MIRNVVVAVSQNGGIGLNGKMPWENKSDMRRFVRLTKGQAVIMGRTTFESIGHPLKNRVNIVVTSKADTNGVSRPSDKTWLAYASSFDEAESIAETLGYKQVYYIGGAQVYQYVMDNDLADTIYCSVIKNCCIDKFDTYFPKFWYTIGNATNGGRFQEKYDVRMVEDADDHTFFTMFRKRHESHCDIQYLNLLRDILDSGVDTPTRVGTARSIFDAHLHFDLRKGLPVLTTKKMALKAVVVELVWFLNGCKNIKYLVDRNVHIWDKDAYAHYVKRAKSANIEPVDFDTFLDGVKNETSIDIDGESYTFGDVGTIYGSQWTDFGHSGVNQLDAVVEKLKTDPNNRRLVVSAWNPAFMDKMALPPCHYAMEFYAEPIPFDERVELYYNTIGLDTKGMNMEYVLKTYNIPEYYLSMRWIQRSCDMALGIPFNILSYAILLSIIAKTVNMCPKMLAGSLGNAHIYKNHTDGVLEMLERNPHLFGAAKLVLPQTVLRYDQITPEDIRIEDYESYPAIKFDLFTDASKQK